MRLDYQILLKSPP